MILGRTEQRAQQQQREETSEQQDHANTGSSVSPVARCVFAMHRHGKVFERTIAFIAFLHFSLSLRTAMESIQQQCNQ